jgi:hypothetical protein
VSSRGTCAQCGEKLGAIVTGVLSTTAEVADYR